MITIKGIVNSPNRDGKFKIKTENDKIIACTYNDFLPIMQGDVIKCKGSYNNDIFIIKQHPFCVIPYDLDIVKKYLIISLKGHSVGSKISKKICDELLIKCITEKGVFEYLDDLCENISLNLPHLNKELSTKFLLWWKKKSLFRRLYLFNLTNKEIMNSDMSVKDIYTNIEYNPFRISSCTLEKAKSICDILDRNITDKEMFCGKILRDINNNPWVGTPIKFLNGIIDIKDLLEKEYKLVFDEDLVYTNKNYIVETELAEKIKSLVKQKSNIIAKFSPLRELWDIEDNIVLTDEQNEALEGALTSNISIITGGAGCGKTTIIQRIIKVFESKGENFVLSSFTGKAVSRIKESLGSGYEDLNYYTLHRMIHSKKKGAWNINFYNIIIDETSMIDYNLMYTFFETFTHFFKIIFIGDINQLPPIGKGCFFNEIINCGKIPTYYLTINKRTTYKGEISGIIENANNLINKSRKVSEPYNFISEKGLKYINGNIGDVIKILSALNEKKINQDDICVITPFNKSINQIIEYYHNIFLPKEKSFVFSEKCWKINDRVMQRKNVYHNDLEVMNGEEGYIIDFDKKEVKVKFSEDKIIGYKIQELELKEDDEIGLNREFYITDLMHSFCKTVHKSQGSEYTYVIFYIPPFDSEFLNINLLYTGITRARKALWIIAQKDILDNMTCRKLNQRYEKLSLRIKN